MIGPATVVEVDPIGQQITVEVECEACRQRLKVPIDLELSTMVAGSDRSLLAVHVYGSPATAGRRVLSRHETTCRPTTTTRSTP